MSVENGGSKFLSFHDALARGRDAVARLVAEMDHGRRVRLEALGFGDDEAARLSTFHTRSFM